MRKPAFKAIVLLMMFALLFQFASCVGENNKTSDTTDNTSQTNETETDNTLTTPESDSVLNNTESDIPTEVSTETESELPDIFTDETLNAPYAESFTVSKAFSSDMVVQRGERLRVWGWADASQNGKKVSGEFMGMFSEAIIEDGQWEITFKAKLPASSEMGKSMKIYTDKKEVIFENVLVGDVYFVIGQSNVAYSVANHMSVFNTDDKGGKGAIDENALIRLNYNTLGETAGYPKRGTEEVCVDVIHNRGWQKATMSNINNFTAIGYYFAFHLQKLLDEKIPIGLIEIDGNGQPLGAFMPNEVANENKTDKYDETAGYYKTAGVNGDAARYMYNHYINPFARYAISGVLWYQGESDFQDSTAKVYVKNFTALMTYMRSTHNIINKDFPVYIMEIPSIYRKPPNVTTWAYMELGKIRSIMGGIPQMLKNSYISVSSDLWNDRTFWNNLHPNCKFEQAERLAKLALAVTHKKITLDEATGPILESVEYSADRCSAILTFSNCGNGLKTSDGGTTVKGFVALRTASAINSKPVTAEITGPNTIKITSSSTIKGGIAYNTSSENFYGKDINLCNSYGNPASAFWYVNSDN